MSPSGISRLPASWGPGSFRPTLGRLRRRAEANPPPAPAAPPWLRGAVLVDAGRGPDPRSMPVLQLDDRQYPLHIGTTQVGAGAGVDVSLPGIPTEGVHALVEVAPEGRTAIRRGEAGVAVRVNGVLLGLEPTPLLHGDKVEIAGHALVFVEDDKAGATRYVSAAEISAITGGRVRAGRATKASGGRLISLLDGKEYVIPGRGVLIGRDASCQVVVPQTEVSRHHAEIAAGADGYVLRDLSTNGVYVNGNRVTGTQRLARSDVIRVGSEEFRFYADVPTPVPEGEVVPAAPMRAAGGAAAAAPATAPARTQPIAAAVPSRASAPVTVKARLSHPVAAAPPEEVRRRGLPLWVWILAALLLAAGAFFVMQGR